MASAAYSGIRTASAKAKVQPTKAQKKEPEPTSPVKKLVGLAVGVGLFALVASVAPAAFFGHFTVFVLACVVGYYVVWNVKHALHTPLMSVTNAISGIIVVGELLQIGKGSGIVTFLAFIAVLIASINIKGGFTVTKRMLEMFRKTKGVRNVCRIGTSSVHCCCRVLS